MGSMYTEKRRGPRMDPCGTSHSWGDGGAEGDENPPRLTEQVLLVKQDLNQFETGPRKPQRFSRWGIRILWSTVANAALKSKSITAVTRVNC